MAHLGNCPGRKIDKGIVCDGSSSKLSSVEKTSEKGKGEVEIIIKKDSVVLSTGAWKEVKLKNSLLPPLFITIGDV